MAYPTSYSTTSIKTRYCTYAEYLEYMGRRPSLMDWTVWSVCLSVVNLSLLFCSPDSQTQKTHFVQYYGRVLLLFVCSCLQIHFIIRVYFCLMFECASSDSRMDISYIVSCSGCSHIHRLRVCSCDCFAYYTLQMETLLPCVKIVSQSILYIKEGFSICKTIFTFMKNKKSKN